MQLGLLGKERKIREAAQMRCRILLLWVNLQREQGVTNKQTTKSCKYGERSKAICIRVATNMQTQFKTNCTKLLLITNLTQFFQCIYFTSLHVSSSPVLIRRELPTGIPNSHLCRVIYTSWCIDTIDFPDDEYWVARNI